MRLESKVAIVTGGGRGIGRAIAIAFAAEGADLCLTARSDDQLNQAADEIRSLGRRALVLPCDVSDRQAVDQVVEQVAAEFGCLHILVNNAGGGLERNPVGQDDPDNWSRVVQVNLLGTYYFSRAVLQQMKRSGGGRIINIGSGMGHEARSGNSSYHAAKAGVWMLTRCLALESWQDQIHVNELIPGPVYTELTAGVFSPQQPHPKIPSEWVKQPQDVVPLAVWLAAQSEHGPTGQSFSLARRPIA